MILVIDNYDSFTYNLVQYLGELGEDVRVRRNDEVSIAEIEADLPRSILISPGPGCPTDAGISLRLIEHFGGRVPILGVCLGHQAIGQVFGGRVVRAAQVVHGKGSKVFHDGNSIFRGLESPFRAGRYHSLVVERASLPACLEVSAETSDGVIMGLRHREKKIEGVQFHPESILTEDGRKLLGNFIGL
ncbi:MAG TPA: aminodeoxychorismate/anthranilate synthase component II [Pyrinomonadaceae bacterium]|nr:aminodeoxychorismate/anthranilate synthase component II [Pyrinomonadaceae bacterium]